MTPPLVQAWQNVTGSRTIAVTYYNTTGKPLFVCVSNSGSSVDVADVWAWQINGTRVGIGSQAYTGSAVINMFFVVPPGASYLVEQLNGNAAHVIWAELR
jgi:hypothetical protein